MTTTNPFAPPASLYDQTNLHHQDWLLWWLDQWEIPFDRLDDWGRQMHGHGAVYLNHLITVYRRWQVRCGLLDRGDLPESPLHLFQAVDPVRRGR